MIFYFRYEKARLERQRIAEAAKGVGRPKVGGKFELLDQEGRRFTDDDMKGGYSLVSGSQACASPEEAVGVRGAPDHWDHVSRRILLLF